MTEHSLHLRDMTEHSLHLHDMTEHNPEPHSPSVHACSCLTGHCHISCCMQPLSCILLLQPFHFPLQVRVGQRAAKVLSVFRILNGARVGCVNNACIALALPFIPVLSDRLVSCCVSILAVYILVQLCVIPAACTSTPPLVIFYNNVCRMQTLALLRAG